ncbi:MAG: type VI secretion system tip protein VgrG [Myxococcales bacterium]|nr:type VI secretion system tip protein VgrG [Myxococcales bacterium]
MVDGNGDAPGLTGEPIARVDYAFDVQGGPNPDWAVRRFHLHEALGQPYALTVDLLTEDTSVVPEQLLGASARLEIDRRDVARSVCGVIERVDYIGVNVDRKLALRLHVVPALRLLEQQVGCRVFQDRTVPEILTEVLEAGLAPFGRQLDASGLSTDAADYPKRDYCVQFRESTLDFVSRLMEEDGITYFFHTEGDKEQLVLVDQSADEPNASFPEVEIIDPDGDGLVPVLATDPQLYDRETLRHFDWCQGLQPNQVVVRSFNWKAFDPGQALETSAPAEAPDAPRRHYVYTEQRKVVDEKAGAEPTSSFDGTAIDEAAADAPRRLQLLQRQTQLGRGRSNVINFAPGSRFTVDDFSLMHLEQLEFLLTRVTHQGDNPGVEHSDGSEGTLYDNAFECIPVANGYRPRRSTPQPRVLGPQTATVTGGEEIHTDKHGRIKVRFHWDEHSPLDGSSSCWVRVAQTWAGPSWGSLFIPRVGMEVVVEFLDGNPDRPLVTGCVYNSANPPPYALPGEKTKSTIKSNSSPGGDGFNELRFEDAAGSEEVFLHAQKDLNEVIGNDMSTSVGHDQSLSVGNDRSKDVTGHETNDIHKDRSTTIDGSEYVHIKGSLNMIVDGGANKGKATDPSPLGGGLAVTGEYNVSATSKLTLTVGNSKIEMDTSHISIQTTAQIKLKVGGSEIIMVPAQIDAKSATVIVSGGDAASVLKLDGAADLKGGSQVLAHKGGSHLKLDGTAEMKGSTATVEGEGVGELKGAPAKVTGGDVEVGGGAISVTGTGTVSVDGSTVELNG